MTDGSDSNQTATAAGGASVPGASVSEASVSERAAVLANERPEVAVGAAFGGGLLLALILKRLAS